MASKVINVQGELLSEFDSLRSCSALDGYPGLGGPHDFVESGVGRKLQLSLFADDLGFPNNTLQGGHRGWKALQIGNYLSQPVNDIKALLLIVSSHQFMKLVQVSRSLAEESPWKS